MGDEATCAARQVSVHVHARTALAGNPSDGFGGAVVSVPIPTLRATASVVATAGADFPLVAATRKRFALATSLAQVAPIAIETTIPRSVGLAGSSAIVIATLRCLAQHHGVELTAMEIATLAHTIERVDLSIAGGWQDQIIQSHGVSMLMEFSPPMKQRTLMSGGLPIWIAWAKAQASENSGESHAPLRERAAAGTRESEQIASTMAELADIARVCADAFEAGDGHAVKACMNTTFDLRAQVMPIAAPHQHMIDLARDAGSAANFAGSGGTIVGVVPKDPAPLWTALDNAGFSRLDWTP